MYIQSELRKMLYENSRKNILMPLCGETARKSRIPLG